MDIKVIKGLSLVNKAKAVMCDEHKDSIASNKEAHYVITIGSKRFSLCDVCFQDMQNMVYKTPEEKEKGMY